MTNPQHKQWAMQWKSAATALQKIRDDELRALEGRIAKSQEDDPYRNGLVEFQRWMMRKALLDAYGNR